ncbi:MAG: TldD/PmbA family protein, partial [Bacteroidales bacterium]|nr:TldD/PmbA family protein [Bacteroidales bacterium]
QIERLVSYLREMREKLFAADGRIVNVGGVVRNRVKRVAIVNSLGIVCEEERPMTDVTLNAVIRHEGQTESAGCSRCYRRDLSMLDDTVQQELVETTLAKLHFALTATQPQGGEMPVVMGAGASGILLHEAIGHAFEADFVRRGESIFTDSLGKKICNEAVTVVDDGLLADARGSIHFDDEGVPSQTTQIVTHGVLTSFLHDRISARHFDIEPTGNGRRESFRSMPLPRMRNTYMLGGQCSESDLIAEVKRGIFVTDFTNGQVQIGAGDYSFFVKAGYLIENGRLTQPVQDVNIIGNGPQTLADIRAVANNPKLEPLSWVCGKEGQSCPVSCGMPSVLVEKLTVG